MKRIILNTALIALLSGIAVPSHAAAYMKFDGVDGESKANTPASSQQVRANGEKPQPIGLLLPAVQKAREAAARSPSPKKSKGKVEASWKVEKGEK